MYSEWPRSHTTTPAGSDVRRCGRSVAGSDRRSIGKVVSLGRLVWGKTEVRKKEKMKKRKKEK